MIQKQNCDLNQNNYNLFAIEEQCMYSKVFKRIIDFILSFFALVILSPLFILLIIIGALVMKGNPFFVQERPGRNETIFKLIKFRTMTNVKDDQGNLLPDNERNSRYGNFLRKTSLDELGELLNIIKGDMSIIGPRPLLLIFVCVKSEKDYIFVPISFLIGSICALVFSILDIKIRYKISYNLPKMNSIKVFFKNSIPFFISRFASTFYQALNVIILGKIYGNSPIVGYYTSSDKVITLSKMASSPIADSLYPYMLKNKNFKIVKKILMIFMPVITLGVILVGIFAEPLCVIAFGNEYAEAGNVLRLLLPIAWVILPTYIIAFPVMSPLGLVKYANRSNVIGMCIQICGLVIIKMLGILNVYTVCGLTSFTEVVVFVYRLLVVLLRKKLRLGGIRHE